MTAPSPFFLDQPKLQRAWDSTSLSALMFCPRFYEYSIMKGYQGSSHDLEFGILIHTALETYEKAVLAGEDRDKATLMAVRYATEASGSYDDGGTWTPWGGRYVTQWKCNGENKYKNAKGNAAKCPYSHKAKWYDTDAPGICGECGSGILTAVNWLPADRAKDRLGLIRATAWWCFEQEAEGGLESIAFDNGTPAVELSFKMPLPFKNSEGEPYVLCGHLDSIVSFGEELFIRDHKSTKKTLGQGFFAGYAPNVQTDTYDLAGWLLFQQMDIRGLVIDGIQLMADGARFGRQIYYRTDAQREEWLAELGWWIKQAERYAEDDHWPMNRRSCWLCQFKGVCSKEPDSRQMWLDNGDFTIRHWNPLEER